MLGRLTLAIGLIVVAGMAFIDLALDRVEIAPVEYVAAAVAIVGIGLLVGGWIGRARWLIVIGALLIPALWVASFAPDNWSYSAGDVYYAPIQASDVQEPFEHGVGSIEVDLTNLSPEQLASAGTIEVSLGAGEMVILVPRDVVVDLRADVGFGEISGPFEGVDGVGIDVDRSFGSGDARMRLDVEVGAGVIRIREEPIQVDTVDSLSSERSGG